jgi:hypothetical protein
MAKTPEERAKESVQWDNNPAVRNLQEKSRAIYVQTGKWNTPEQQELNKQATVIRTSANPMTSTVIDPRTGPVTQGQADMIYPRDTTPGLNTVEGGADSIISNTGAYGSYLKMGIGVFVLMIFVSLFRR